MTKLEHVQNVYDKEIEKIKQPELWLNTLENIAMCLFSSRAKSTKQRSEALGALEAGEQAERATHRKPKKTYERQKTFSLKALSLRPSVEGTEGEAERALMHLFPTAEPPQRGEGGRTSPQ